MEITKITRVGVYGVYFKKEKMLLIEQQRGPFKGKYDFPGGGIEFGETPKIALQREFAEEVAMGFDSLELKTNITSVLEVPKTEEKPAHTFYQVGMIYQVSGVYPLSGEETGELQYFWVDTRDLQEQNCSALLWQWVSQKLKHD